MDIRVGQGYDVHAFADNRELWLGGVKIEHEKGLAGHSDADVLLHALCDALLGAANMRDIGYHFPDSGQQYAGIDSKILLQQTYELLLNKGYRLGNADCIICAQAPKLSPHIDKMRECIAGVLKVEPDRISIKATTTERLGFVGRKEGIVAYATVLITKD